jgi:prevent-host-death family protein
MEELQLKDAKATLSADVDRAVAGEPTVITRQGRNEAVLVSFEEWERISKVPSFADLLLAFPAEPDDVPERAKLSRATSHFRTLRSRACPPCTLAREHPLVEGTPAVAAASG